MMLLCSAETGAPLRCWQTTGSNRRADGGDLGDDRAGDWTEGSGVGIVGSGIQARLKARLHAWCYRSERIVLVGTVP